MIPARNATSLRVIEDVLAVAGAELQPPHQPQHFGVEVVEPELEGGRFPLAADGLLHLRLDLLDDFLDAGRVDAAVGNQPLDGAGGRPRGGTDRSWKG